MYALGMGLCLVGLFRKRPAEEVKHAPSWRPLVKELVPVHPALGGVDQLAQGYRGGLPCRHA